MIGFAAALVAAFLLASPVLAQQRTCAPAVQVEAALTNRYGEQQLARGLTQESLVEIWVSDDKRTFTITVRTTGNAICIIASGTDFETATAARTGPGT